MTVNEIKDIINYENKKTQALRDLRGIKEIEKVAEILFEKFKEDTLYMCNQYHNLMCLEGNKKGQEFLEKQFKSCENESESN